MVKDHSDRERGNPLPTLVGLLFPIRSGQVRSESLTCTFRASCCSARLSWAQVLAFAGSSIRDRKKEGGGGKDRGGGGAGNNNIKLGKVSLRTQCYSPHCGPIELFPVPDSAPQLV